MKPEVDLSVDISIVMPVYNEQESLTLLHENVLTMLTDLQTSWEIIYVDDGSNDGSTEILRALVNQDDRVKLAVQRRNYGKSVALMTGFALAQGQNIATMDSDLQDEPNEIPRLLDKLAEGYDIVTGWKQDRQDPFSKRLPSKIANTITSWLSGLYLHDMNSGLKVFSGDCARSLRIYGDMHRYVPVIAYLDGFRVTELPVIHHPRQFGKSKYGTGRLLRGGLDLITVLFLSRYGRRPLHLFGSIGGLFMFIGFVINTMLALEWFRGIRPLGDRPALLLGILLMLVGLQLLTTGLIGELIVQSKQEQTDPLSTVRKLHVATPNLAEETND